MLPGAFIVVDGVETPVALDEDITDGKNVYHEIIFDLIMCIKYFFAFYRCCYRYLLGKSFFQQVKNCVLSLQL